MAGHPLSGELIGIDVQIDGALRGTIIDETKHTFTISTQRGKKKIIKEAHHLTFLLPQRNVAVEGKKLVARPEDRIKIKQW